MSPSPPSSELPPLQVLLPVVDILVAAGAEVSLRLGVQLQLREDFVGAPVEKSRLRSAQTRCHHVSLHSGTRPKGSARFLWGGCSYLERSNCYLTLKEGGIL